MARARETVPVPTRRETKDAARETAKGHPSGGRVLEQQREAKGTLGRTRRVRTTRFAALTGSPP